MLRRGMLCLSYNLHLKCLKYDYYHSWSDAERRGAMLRRGVLCLSYNLHLNALNIITSIFGAMLRGEEQC